MFRRRFIQSITFAGAGTLAATGVAEAKGNKTITYRVKGFTCITCAVGLETLLRREKGIARVEASYPKATVLIEFDPDLVSDKSLRERISEMGFTVVNASGNAQRSPRSDS